MSTQKDLPQARASAAADDERRGLVAFPGRSLAGRTKDLMARYELRPRKSLGQNFLLNESKLERLAAATAELAPELIIEVGPGLGALTVPLARLGRPLVAFEIDERMRGPLAEVLQPFDNVTVRFEDVLEADLAAVTGGRPFMVAGNLPYQITTPLLGKLFALEGCQGLVITVQREVALRLQAAPGTRDYGPLTLFCQYHVAAVETICQFPPGDFLPAPDVASTGLRLLRRTAPPFAEPSAEVFQDVVRAAFNQRRKSLLGGLANSPQFKKQRERVATALDAAGIDGQRRAETLTMDELARLAQALEVAR